MRFAGHCAKNSEDLMCSFIITSFGPKASSWSQFGSIVKHGGKKQSVYDKALENLYITACDCPDPSMRSSEKWLFLCYNRKKEDAGQ